MGAPGYVCHVLGSKDCNNGGEGGAARRAAPPATLLRRLSKQIFLTNPGDLGAGRGLGVGQDLRDARALRRLHGVRLNKQAKAQAQS